MRSVSCLSLSQIAIIDLKTKYILIPSHDGYFACVQLGFWYSFVYNLGMIIIGKGWFKIKDLRRLINDSRFQSVPGNISLCSNAFLIFRNQNQRKLNKHYYWLQGIYSWLQSIYSTKEVFVLTSRPVNLIQWMWIWLYTWIQFFSLNDVNRSKSSVCNESRWGYLHGFS